VNEVADGEGNSAAENASSSAERNGTGRDEYRNAREISIAENV
jgi:hypothetical protein